MHKIAGKLKEEFLAVLPPTIFFFVVLHIVSIIRVLMAKGSHFEPMAPTSILVASLILGKAVLVADMATLLHYLERLIDFSRQAGGLAAGHKKLLAEIFWPHFWAVEILMFVLILNYCIARELVRVLGREKALRMFFGPISPPDLRENEVSLDMTHP